MRVRYKRLALCLLACGLAVLSHAQQPDDAPLRFDHLTLEDGLMQRVVSDLMQDRRGFMWFATQAGINRYDGYSFMPYKYDPDDPNSLLSNQARSIHEDKHGVVWIGTSGGLSRFDPVNDVFTNYVHVEGNPNSLNPGWVQSIFEDQDSLLWIGTDGGLSRFDPATETFVNYVHDEDNPNSVGSGRVYAIHEDRDSVLWVGTDAGLSRFDPATETFTHYVQEEDPPVRPGSPSDTRAVRAIYDDRDGVLWVGAWGLSRFDRTTGTFTRYLPDPRYPNLDDPTVRRGSNSVSVIYEDRDGTLWVGCSWGSFGDGGGLYRFDRASDTFTRYAHDPADASSLLSDHVHGIYQDRQGVLWIGTDQGLSRLDRASQGFRLYQNDPENPDGLKLGPYPVPFLDREGFLWINDGVGGANRFDRATGTVTHFQYDPDDPAKSPGGFVAMSKDREGKQWFATTQGLYRYDRDSERFTLYLNDPDLGTDIVYGVLEDRHGEIWAVSYPPRGRDARRPSTLHRFDRESETFTPYPPPGDDAVRPEGPGNRLYEDQRGVLWIGTYGGLYRFDRGTGSFTRFQHDPTNPNSLSDNTVETIYERPQEPSILWIGTGAGGLNRFDTQTGRFERFTQQNSGLPDNRIYGILGDDVGRLWMSTDNGIVRFDPEAETFKQFDTDDGLQSKEFDGLAYHRAYTGEMFFGGYKGLNAFFPEQITDNPHPPQVVLTGLMLSDMPVAVGAGSPLAQALSETEVITLKHDENDVTFEYVGMHYRDAAKNQYQYMLGNYDEEWRKVGTRREATYTSLPPGDYVFRVKASNSDGVWSEKEGTQLAITILPPWWRTWWAYGLYGLLLMAGVLGVYRWQHARIVRGEREKAHKVLEAAHTELDASHHQLQETHQHLKTTQAQLIQSEKMASLGELTAGIAHEIKNPLNFITGFAEVNEELADELREAWQNGTDDVDDLLGDLKQNAQIINQHGKRADGIVKSMMQHASGGSGQREMVEVNDLLEEYVNLAYHGKRAQNTDFALEVERAYDEQAGAVEMVPQEVGRVFLNLLSNAFDAVKETPQPMVTVSTQRHDGHVEIRVHDNGPGIAPAARDKIFEPFFTTKPTGSGTGLGLSLSYDIVTQGHGGTLTVESTEGKGATFMVTLPG